MDVARGIDYVGNLKYSVSEDVLRDMFSEFGDVASVDVIKDKFSGQSKVLASSTCQTSPRPRMRSRHSTTACTMVES